MAETYMPRNFFSRYSRISTSPRRYSPYFLGSANQRDFQSRSIINLCAYGWTIFDIKLFNFLFLSPRLIRLWRRLYTFLYIFIGSFAENERKVAGALVYPMPCTHRSRHHPFHCYTFVYSKFFYIQIL